MFQSWDIRVYFIAVPNDHTVVLKKGNALYMVHMLYTQAGPPDDQQKMVKSSMELYSVPILLETENS